MLKKEDITQETWSSRLAKLSTLGLRHRLVTSVLYTAMFSVYPGPPGDLDLTTAQAFILALFRSFLAGDAAAVFSLLPLVPQLPQLESSYIAVWFREDFSFKRQDVTRALSWLARFIKKEGPVVPLNILLVFSSLEEKYQVFNYFQEVGDTVGQEMLIYHNPLITRRIQDRIKDVKDQSIEARPEMVSKGTQTTQVRQEKISIPLTSSISKELTVAYAAYQNIESIQTETIYEEPENFNEASTTKLNQQPDDLLIFLSERSEPAEPHPTPIYLKVRPSATEKRRCSERPRSVEVLPPDGRSSGNNTPTILLRPQEAPRFERPRSLQSNEIYSIDETQRYATTSRIRPISSIEQIRPPSQETHRNDRPRSLQPNETSDGDHIQVNYSTFRTRSNSSLSDTGKRNSTLKRNAAAAKAEATKRLMKAAERGDTTAAVAAIAEGADVDHRDSVRRTALHLAVVGGDEELVRRLLAAGAAKDKKDSMGRTPLHYTALRDRPACAQLLVEAGADLNPRDSSGLTPTTLASIKHHSGVVTVLKRKGGQDCSIS